MVYESKNPLTDLTYRPEGGRGPLTPQDGWIGPVRGSGVMVELPDGIFRGSKRNAYRIVLEAETEQTTDIRWKIRIKNAKGTGYGSGLRMPTPPGKSGRMRYVMDCSAVDSHTREVTDTLWLSFWGESSGRLRPLSIRVEALQ